LTSKKLTILLIPDGSKKTRQVRVPRFLAVFFLVFLVPFIALMSWIIWDYQSIKSQMPRLVKLENECDQKEKHFVYFAQRIQQMRLKMGELGEFDRKLRVMVNLKEDVDNPQLHGIGGSDPAVVEPEKIIGKTHRELAELMHRSLDNLDNEVALAEQDKAELHKFLESQKMLLASTPSIWPVKGWMSSRFGSRMSPFTGKKEFHKGIDIATRIGAPVVAPADGIVSVNRWNRGYGNMLMIKHGHGIITRYAHLQKALVKKGQHVKRGETIALVGNSGRSTGPHLHYEVHLNKVRVNPLQYILN